MAADEAEIFAPRKRRTKTNYTDKYTVRFIIVFKSRYDNHLMNTFIRAINENVPNSIFLSLIAKRGKVGVP